MKKRIEVYVHDTRLPGTLREQKRLYNRLKSKSENNPTNDETELLSLVTKNLIKHNHLNADGKEAKKISTVLYPNKKSLRRRLNQIKKELQTESSPIKRELLNEEISAIKLKLSRMRPQPLPKKPRTGKPAPIPKSYIKEKNEKIENAHKVSGYKKIRIKFVQGGRATGK